MDCYDASTQGEEFQAYNLRNTVHETQEHYCTLRRTFSIIGLSYPQENKPAPFFSTRCGPDWGGMDISVVIQYNITTYGRPIMDVGWG